MILELQAKNDLKLLAVDVPGDAHNFRMYDETQEYLYFDTMFGWEDTDMRTLPSGKYSILGLLKDISEERAVELVRMVSNGKISGRPQYFKYNYDNENPIPSLMWTRTALESLTSLILSAGGDIETNYLIIKQL